MSDSIGKLFLCAILLPIALGYLRWLGEKHGLYGSQTGIALMILAWIAIFSAVLSLHFRSLRRREAERRLAEEVWRDLFDHASCGYHSLDSEGTFLNVNETELKWLGYGRDELIGKKTFFDLLRPQDREATRRRFAAFKESGSVKELEFDLIRKDGTVLPVLLNSTAVRDSRGRYLFSRSTVFDVTEHRRMETELREARENLEATVRERTAELSDANLELQKLLAVHRRTEALLRGREAQLNRSKENLRRLTAHLNKVREAERARISREIHDELGQQLTGLKMDLCWIQAKLRRREEPYDPSACADKLGEVVHLVDATIDKVRRIATELRPGVLDDLGLIAAMEWQAQDFEKRSGIACAFFSELKDASLDTDRATEVFRIFQEILTNVARHAQASRVEVRLATDREGLLLEVRDDGRGITAEESSHSKSLGLLGMRERAYLLGGSFELEGRAGAGTRALLRVPLASTAPPERRWDPSCEF